MRVGPKRRLAFAIAALLFVGHSEGARAQSTPSRQAEAEAVLSALLPSDPTMSALAEFFPAEWETIRRDMLADVISTMPVAELNARSHARMRAFINQRAGDIAQASTETLVTLLASDLAVLEALEAENVQYCADFGMRGIQPGSRLSGDVVRQLGRANRTRIRAAFEGGVRPARRNPATEKDWTALLDVIEAGGASDALIDSIVAGGEGATPALQCAGTMALYRGLSALPMELGAKLYGSIIIAAAETP